MTAVVIDAAPSTDGSKTKPKPQDDAATTDATDKAKSVPLLKLFRYADGLDKLLMIVGTLAAIATGTSQPLQIILFGDTLNAFNPTPPADGGNFTADELEAAITDGVNRVALQFVWVGLAVLVTGLLQVGCWSWTAARQTRRLRELYVRAILTQEIGWFDVNDPMTLSTKVADRMHTIQEGTGRKVGECLNFYTMAVAGITIGLIKGWKLALTLLAFTPFLALAAFLMARTITAAMKSSLDAYGKAGAVAEEALGSVRTVHMFNLVDKLVIEYRRLLDLAEKAGIQKGFSTGWGTGIMFGSMILTYSFGMYYGTVLVSQDQLGDTPCTHDCYDGGRVMIVFCCIVMGAMGLGQAGPSIQAIMAARAAAADVFELLERVSPIDPMQDTGRQLDQVRGDIELRAVRFHYPSRPDVAVCDGYSLQIVAGQKVAFVGPSGSGKSTIISLVERFYDPVEGSVLLDGVDLRSLHVGWLRQQIGLVGQEPVLFAESIAANIGRGKPGVTQQEIEQAAKQANAFDFIMSFPAGFATEVGDRGLQLSGGQKQRIAIARAIIKNPAILLLDEATSALDTESERIVQASLDALLASRQRTTIIVAHRLSTIRDADRIIVMSAGRVVEDGNHRQLMAIDNGRYQQLVSVQEKKVKSEVAAATEYTEVDLDAASAIQAATLPSPALVQVHVVLDSQRDTKTDVKDEKDKETDKEKEDEKPPAPPSGSKWRLWKMSRPELGHLLAGSLAALINGATFPVWGVLLTKVVVVFYSYELTPDEMKARGQLWAVGFLILAIVFTLAIIAQNYCFAVVSERLTTRLRLAVFQAMLKQDMAWFDLDDNTAGALTTRLANDCAVLQSMTSDSLNRSLVMVMTVGVAYGIAFYSSWKMTLVLIAVFPVMGLASFVQIKILTDTGKNNYSASDTKAGALLSESIAAIRTVASFHMERRIHQEYAAHASASGHTAARSGLLNGLGFGFSQGMVFCVCGFLYWYGGKLVSKQTITFEQMFMVFICIMFSSMGLGMAGQNVADPKKVATAAINVFATLDRVPAIDVTRRDGQRLDHVRGEIEFRNLQFAYPNRPTNIIYHNYSLTIPSGKTVALVGASGSGKSTAISLLERFYDPQEGTILLDGHDIKSLDINWLREHVSLVAQEPVLFAGTIADNIGNGKPGATRDQIIEAAKMANAYDFITQFPDGFDTAVGDRGAQLSGGQKQRIAIARAILRDPEVLLLDEATSALDNESERVVQESLDRLLSLKKRTTIVVAHRLTTIQNADLIAVTQGGQIVELGTHNTLMAMPEGVYRKLVSCQIAAQFSH